MTESQRHDITKYPNRRFYDGTASRHVTLTDLYDIVRRGGEIVVTDKETGRDITNVVLTQIILEHDPPKMELFPSSLLHQAIQANESVMRRFIDQYFAQALDAFNQSSSRFDQFLSSAGFAGANPFDWARMMMPGMGNPSTSSGANERDTQSPAAANTTGMGRPDAQPIHSDDRSGAPRDQDLDAVRQQLADMQAELARLRHQQDKPSKKKRKTSRKTAAVKKRSKKRGTSKGRG